MGFSYAGAFGYADDVSLVAPSLRCLQEMTSICENYANRYCMTFNPCKSKLLCYNVDSSSLAPVFIYGELIKAVNREVHLGNPPSTNINDRNIIYQVYGLYQCSASVIIDFNTCDSVTFDHTYCLHMYGCEL